MVDLYIRNVSHEFLERAATLCAGLTKVDIEFSEDEELTMRQLRDVLQSAVAAPPSLITVEFTV